MIAITQVNRRAWSLVLLPLLPVGLATDYWRLPIPAQGPAPPDAIEVVADLSASACGVCHVAQFRDWQSSLHARSVSPGMLGQLDQLDGATVANCLGCHAPREEAAARWWADGLDGQTGLAPVDCTTCHVRAHSRHGPRAVPYTPHRPVLGSAAFRDSAFCAPCHQFGDEAPRFNGMPLQDTYGEWSRSRYAREGITCQACHMPGGSHRIRGIHDPALTREGLGLQAQRTAEGVRVRVGNQGAGHALPTYVTPRIVVRLAGAAAAEAGAPSLEHVIARQMAWTDADGWLERADTRLLPDQWRELTLVLPAAMPATVTVTVDPGHDYHARIYPDLLRRWHADLDPMARGLLAQARAHSAGARYLLYRSHCPPWSGAEQDCTSLAPSLAPPDPAPP